MRKLRWYQYVAMWLGVVALLFVAVGIVDRIGLLIVVGAAMIVGGVIPLWRSKDKTKGHETSK